jgi:beta-hydroxylase
MNFDPMLDFVLSTPFVVIVLFVVTALYVHSRSRTRLKLRRELFGPATLLAPINTPIYLSSSVPSRPFLELDFVPGLRFLEEHWQELREEAEQLDIGGKIRSSASFDDPGFNSFFRRGWKRFYLLWYGKPLPSAEQLCPRTLELLAQVPAVRAAMFVRMAPRSRLPGHRDPYAGSLRFHLGLKTPNSPLCYIEVDGEQYWWKDGEGVLFDETYMHRAWNKSDEDRLILFCDVERPLRFAPMRWFNRLIGNTLMRGFGTRNVPGEKLGIISRIFSFVYPIRLAGKHLRRKNQAVYYTLKYALIALVLYLLIF